MAGYYYWIQVQARLLRFVISFRLDENCTPFLWFSLILIKRMVNLGFNLGQICFFEKSDISNPNSHLFSVSFKDLLLKQFSVWRVFFPLFIGIRLTRKLNLKSRWSKAEKINNEMRTITRSKRRLRNIEWFIRIGVPSSAARLKSALKEIEVGQVESAERWGGLSLHLRGPAASPSPSTDRAVPSPSHSPLSRLPGLSAPSSAGSGLSPEGQGWLTDKIRKYTRLKFSDKEYTGSPSADGWARLLLRSFPVFYHFRPLFFPHFILSKFAKMVLEFILFN